MKKVQWDVSTKTFSEQHEGFSFSLMKRSKTFLHSLLNSLLLMEKYKKKIYIFQNVLLILFSFYFLLLYLLLPLISLLLSRQSEYARVSVREKLDKKHSTKRDWLRAGKDGERVVTVSSSIRNQTLTKWPICQRIKAIAFITDNFSGS